MLQVSATLPESTSLSAPLALPRFYGADAPAPNWATNVERYYGADDINARTKQWLELPMKWLEIEEQQWLYGTVRHCADRLLAALLLIMLAPFFVIIAVIIRLSSDGPALYTQARIGLGCRAFKIYKFRTMVRDAHWSVPFAQNTMTRGMFKVKNDARIVPFGRFLRRWSLDELPQLINVVKGDMALIGPRPLEPEHACAVPAEHMIRFALRPGITGLWQATDRGSRDGFAKFAMDADYVQRRTARLDLYLCLKTIGTILSGIGAD